MIIMTLKIIIQVNSIMVPSQSLIVFTFQQLLLMSREKKNYNLKPF